MSTYTYLLIDLSIILPPLLIGLLPRYAYLTQIRRLLKSIIPVSLSFIVWDMIATRLNHWQFSTQYTLPYRMFHLPLEEIAFFIVVPFACLFIAHSLFVMIPQLHHSISQSFIKVLINRLPFIFGASALIGLIMNRNQGYTAIVLSLVVLTHLNFQKQLTKLFFSRLYWAYLGLSFLAFLIINGLLTSLPVVTYSEWAITNISLYTIPIEDFVYNYLLLTAYFFFYTYDVQFKFDSLRPKLNSHNPI